MSDRAEFEKRLHVPEGALWSEKKQGYYWSNFPTVEHPLNDAWEVWQEALEHARAHGATVPMTRIAEKKLEQMGGDVCGVLVRKDGKLAAVDEHGRVQWLQSGKGAEPAGSLKSCACQFDSKGELLKECLYHQTRYKPQPAQQGVPEGWSVQHIDDPSSDGYLVKGPGISYCVWKDKEAWLYLFFDALVEGGQGNQLQEPSAIYDSELSGMWQQSDFEGGDPDERSYSERNTHPHNGEQGGEWVKCSERLPTEADTDCDGCLWVCWYDHGWRMDREYIKSIDCEYFAWMPTGLKRPQPPKHEGNGDE